MFPLVIFHQLHALCPMPHTVCAVLVVFVVVIKYSVPELVPQIVRPVEGDAKGCPSTLCIPHDMEPKPQIPPHSSVSPRYHQPCNHSLHDTLCVCESSVCFCLAHVCLQSHL